MALPLLCADLNGCLVSIHAHRLAGRTADFRFGSKYCVRRPYLEQFLAYALTEWKVAIWTSRNAENARRCVEALFTAEQLERIAFVYCQDQCVHEPSTDPNRSFPFVTKPLDRIFDHEAARGLMDSQVVVCDDSIYKLRYGVRRPLAYVIKTFDPEIDPNGAAHDVELLKFMRQLQQLRGTHQQHLSINNIATTNSISAAADDDERNMPRAAAVSSGCDDSRGTAASEPQKDDSGADAERKDGRTG